MIMKIVEQTNTIVNELIPDKKNRKFSLQI